MICIVILLASIIGATRFHHFFCFFGQWQLGHLRPCSPHPHGMLRLLRSDRPQHSKLVSVNLCTSNWMSICIQVSLWTLSSCNTLSFQAPAALARESQTTFLSQHRWVWFTPLFVVSGTYGLASWFQGDCGISKTFCKICSVNAEENAPHRVPSHHRSRFARSAPERFTIFADKATRKSMEGGHSWKWAHEVI